MIELKLHDEIDATEALQYHVQKNVEEMENYFSGKVDVRLSKQGPATYTAEFRTRLFGRLLRVEASDKNIYVALTKARHHLTRQVDEFHHERIQRRKRNGSRQKLRDRRHWTEIETA